ncbi:neutrophil cytosol factor 2 isoform X1 [Entelurus aequoreus]|uniref:neutrophil cytosol factor 2 isoform X1 n=1 Tax=Entelurus aequoreus TaxID=161455 RepID=UPI002B1CFAFB|nr:neutrophil cytosol factor 2 isoform X1 [Entelurus aequoreus]XP_061877482.1 neutrophil cytosol factor 2 isoform X1 [Entelurus aequoreus]XP_061877483.1 neutrophil cytosol factor 2 isoform X1 [Entelurus aequoreus]
MAFLDTLRQWDEAISCVDRQDLKQALEIFLSIEDPNSKISFNVGCLQLVEQKLDAAEKAFDFSISKDEHLAVAFFQRAITFYKKQRFQESVSDFQLALKALRGNQLIDYKALGLRYKLYACEVLHNMALAEAHLGEWERAQKNLVKALEYKTDNKLNILDRAMQSILKQNIFKAVEFPSTALFRPNKYYVAQLDKKDYLGKAKVVASVIPQDHFSGFAPLQPQFEKGPDTPKEPEVLRALEGEAHIVRYEFLPETSDELAVVPGNIVFVLQKGSDNWASVVFNGRKGLVPYNYLERLEMSLGAKQKQEESPSREPPSRPERKQGVGSTDDIFLSAVVRSNSSSADVEPKEAQPADKSCIVKVYYTFNVAVRVTSDCTYSMLVEKMSKKLKRASSSFTLSFTSEANSVMSKDTDMVSVWSRTRNRRLKLWCHIKELQDTEMIFVARHSYESSNPEDLTFNKGDTITLISKVNQDWLEGYCEGNTGIFPASFVEQLSINQ